MILLLITRVLAKHTNTVELHKMNPMLNFTGLFHMLLALLSLSVL